MRGDGDGWLDCGLGHRHWGRHGAAGLLLYTATDGRAFVLLQHRASFCHHGDTWGIPGGARDSHETTIQAALREADEEAGIDPSGVTVHHEVADDHNGWSYTTVLAHAPQQISTTPNRESLDLVWHPVDHVTRLDLHPGFAATWSVTGALPVHILVDAANVVGSQPDGWWRDRAGSTQRYLRGWGRLPAQLVRLPDGRAAVVTSITAVLEGQARDAGDQEGVDVRRAPAAGDDTIVELAARSVTGSLVVVTADRGLRARLPSSAIAVGPAWLRSVTG